MPWGAKEAMVPVSWTTIYIAPNKATAENLKGILSREGILVNLRFTGLVSHSGGAHIEVMVPEGEVEEAHEILNEVLGRTRL